ncbi:MAG: protoporphyrinogen/coproporphyrinogen oxidase [Myxococcaceae bacterium]
MLPSFARPTRSALAAEATGSYAARMGPLLILGGGLAGLSAAHFSDSPWLLVEKSSRLGGLARTEITPEGFHFDATGHWLHLRDPEMKSWVLEKLLPGRLETLQRRAAIFSRGVFTRFPYQINTHGLPAEIVVENVLGFVEAHWGERGRALRDRQPANFEEFVLRHLGEGFAKNFMLPYNEKLWTVPPKELSAAWCGRFVPKPSLREVLEGALGMGSDTAGYNASFLYPAAGGIESLPKAIVAGLKGGEVRTGIEPTAIDARARRVRFSDGSETSYRALVASIALPRLVELVALGSGGLPHEVSDAARQLRATTVTYVNLGVRGAPEQPWHWVYLPEPEFRAYRVGSPAAVLPSLAPSGHTSFYVEFSHRGDLSRSDAAAWAQAEVVRAKLVRDPHDIVLTQVREIPQAYVLYDTHYGDAMKRISDWLDSFGLLRAGRYGQWEYSSMEDALLSGRTAARAAQGART